MRRIVLLGMLVALCGVSRAAAQVAPATPPSIVTVGPHLGVALARGAAASSVQASVTVNNLAYNGGPVMRTNTVYAIYWVPSGYSVSSRYETLINSYFQNVHAAGAIHATNDVYYAGTQYSDTTGAILFSSTFAGYVVDTNPYPANGCTDPYTTVCLADTQLFAEIQRVITAHLWTPGPSKLFFLFTPKNVGSCYSTVLCTYTTYCGYHGWFTNSAGQTTYYANMPYATFVPTACDPGQHPNGDDADATLNFVSHEHNEAITDPHGNAWFDTAGNEDGDKCSWNFGAALGKAANGALYNQMVNGARYYLQQEWSNYTTRCVLIGK